MSHETIALIIFFVLIYLNVGYIIGAKMWDIYENLEDHPILQQVLWPMTDCSFDSPVHKLKRVEYALLMSIFWPLHFLYQLIATILGSCFLLIYKTLQIFTLLGWWVAK